MPIDYAMAQREMPKLKGALTRAQKSGDPLKVLDAVERALDAFDRFGAWPDNWSLWRRAFDDAFFAWSRSEARDDDVFDNGGKTLARWHAVGDRFAF